MIKFRLRKRGRLWLHMVACACFIALAIYGWELPVETALVFLLICVVALVAIIALAAFAGWILRMLRRKSDE